MSDYDLVPNDDFGDIQPYSQPNTPLAPIENESWAIPAPDFIDDHQSFSNTSPQIFGSAFPGSMQQAEQAVSQIANVFRADAAKMRLDSALVDAAITWFKTNALLPVGHVEKRHRYDLTGYSIPRSDRDAVTSFLNFMDRHGAPQRFVTTTLWWLSELFKQSQPQQQSASQDSITDAEWDYIEKRAPADQANCEAILRNHWGNQFPINLRLAKNYLATLPVEERDKLTQTVCKGGILSGNTPEVVLALYKAAIGGDRMPKNGPAIAAEIASIENLMKTNRKAYLADENLQARLRELYTLRGY
ncbi:hypothetical protein [Pseudogulbenkiania subflava]|uniref:Uncharacterized protein n=1 Tax=Pseudogulbenkiania subflava DSM 22618 TaxID=1123014 RepID=A0A1Y6C9R2_9NEIS|nr:hypothetical protein [Pseudogulbenkiania subflava]SMF53346.1 hypothetical protein SAMN02745746_03811 [Pseudogulbenkiania subflava DSM 22618]